MALFGTYFAHFFLEPFCLYLRVLHVKRMRLFHPFEKSVKVYCPKNDQKLKKMAILSVMLAILRPFSRFLPDDHLNICFSDQQGFT